MIFNKILNITDEDVVIQDDIEVLNQWRNSLEAQLTTILAGVDTWQSLPYNRKIAYQYLFILHKIVKNRLNECYLKKRAEGALIRQDKINERSFAMEFMITAKRELRREDYSRILKKVHAERKEKKEERLRLFFAIQSAKERPK